MLCILFSFQAVVTIPVIISALPSVGPGCSVTLGVDFKSILSATSGAEAVDSVERILRHYPGPSEAPGLGDRGVGILPNPTLSILSATARCLSGPGAGWELGGLLSPSTHTLLPSRPPCPLSPERAGQSPL